VKKTRIGLVILCACSLGLTACASIEEKSAPVITSKPKVMIVDAATPTPTLTVKEGEAAKPTESVIPTETPFPATEETAVPTEAATSTPTPKPIKAPTAAPTPTKAPTATPKPTKTPTATPKPTKAERRPYGKGVLSEAEFKSEWMGMKFAAGEGIELLPQEELDELMRLMEEASSGKKIPGDLVYENLALVYELSLVWQDKGLTMQVMVERMADSQATEEDYVAAMQEELGVLEENGFTYHLDEKNSPRTIAGKEFANFGYTTYYDEFVSLHQENYIRKQDDRMILISIMGESEDGVEELIKLFKEY